jgi:hypothetical protein
MFSPVDFNIFSVQSVKSKSLEAQKHKHEHEHEL